ncbi:Tyrosinase [Fusarium beomiforme]|uniref:Tyrosinase n=1 Tax=Fusarium beomiforme TaxID=44412 RepID=A0A9P5AV13_9HYPO|nr:Tyrosinase [Fusarium beomiforme]
MLYWDWSLDADNVPASPIWDAKTGLGGNGSPSKTEPYANGRDTRKCVIDGPFKDFRPVFQGTNYEPHCLSRRWNNGTEQVGDMLSPAYTKETVSKIQNIEGYDEYRQKLESRPHGAIHSAIGGDMVPNTSPNDPIFFLHHTQIDRLWALWQGQDPDKRYTDFSGIKTQNQFDGTTPPSASLSDTLLMMGLADDLTVKDLMTTQSPLLCYTYEVVYLYIYRIHGQESL